MIVAGEPQVYGTQHTNDPDSSNLRQQPVADLHRPDVCRAAVDLEPAADYDRHMRHER